MKKKLIKKVTIKAERRKDLKVQSMQEFTDQRQ